MKNVVVAGGGASGMMAAIMLANKGYKTVIIEKNDKLGKKLFITGKGRCNITNNCNVETLFNNVVTNKKFLYSAFYGFDSKSTMDFFEGLGLKLKTERGGRVFPISDHSSDVIGVLKNKLKRLGVEIKLNCVVKELLYSDYEKSEDEKNKYEKKVIGVVYSDGQNECRITSDYVVIATGGFSYQLTGSTGDGYKFAKDAGLNVIKPLQALVPLEIKEPMCKELMGLALKNIKVSYVACVKNKRKELYNEFGEMLFTHFGVSGPVILSASSIVNKYIDNDLKMYIDFKPALSEKQLDERLLRDFEQNHNKQFRNALNDLLPKKIIPYIIEKSGIDQYKKVNIISKEERMNLIKVLKQFELTVSGLRDFDEAIITNGGIDVKEINPQTMEAKKVKGLHFIGEVLDLDAFTGGFNLQIAWSTAAALI